jgi:hypothetical protein
MASVCDVVGTNEKSQAHSQMDSPKEGRNVFAHVHEVTMG